MAADPKERKFIDDVLNKATAIISNQEDLSSAVDIFGDRGYASGLEDSDFESYGITKAQFTAVADFVENFNLFLDGEDVVNKDQRKVLNILRIDR